MNSSVAQANRSAEIIQTKAFTAWVNSHLRKVGQPEISDLLVDLQDGVALCHLIGHLTHHKVRGFTAKPKTPAHKLANLSLALDTAEAADVRLESLGPQDVYDMNTKLVLGFIWTLIVKFGAQGAAGGAQGLQARLEQLAGCPVPNLTTAFSDGVLLSKMIDRKRKGLLNPDTLDPSRAADNVGNALYILQRDFHMPHVLDAADIANSPDDKAMLTFLPYVVEALEGRPLVDDAGGPAVFARTSAPSVAPAPAAAAAPPVSPGRGAHTAAPAKSWRTPPAAAPAPVFVAPRPSGPRSSAALPYSQPVSAKHPGIPFTALNVDGRSPEGALPCQQCGGELGNGRCFRFNHNGGLHYIHSRCFDCSVCRKDFTTGVFYLNQQNRLQCVQHAMEELGLICKACGEAITDFVVNALDANWHDHVCFSCRTCRKPFVEPKFFNGDGYPYCDVCYAAFQGRVCARCGKGSPNAIKALDKYWCDGCFTCGTCNQRIAENFVEADGFPFHADCLKGGAPPSSSSSSQHQRPYSPPPPPAAASYPAAASRPPRDDHWSPPSLRANPPAPASSSSPSQPASPCARCGQDIPVGDAVTVSGKRYHKPCFSCFKCREPIKGSFYDIPGQGFCCPKCEKELPPMVEGGNVPCAKCNKTLVGAVVQALGKEYHKECFGCAVCSKPFSSNSFYTFQGKPVCQDHAMG